MDRGPRLLLASSGVSSTDLGVYTIVGALMAIGLVLMLIAAWLFKATKPEMELLSPLERMSERSWKKLDPAMQRRELDQLRPVGARPIERATQIPTIDEDFDKAVPDLADFDDLTSMQAADTRRRTAEKASEVGIATVAADHTAAGPDAAPDGDDTAETDSPDLLDAAGGSATPPRGQPSVDDDGDSEHDHDSDGNDDGAGVGDS